jgi:hypothetical protein
LRANSCLFSTSLFRNTHTQTHKERWMCSKNNKATIQTPRMIHTKGEKMSTQHATGTHTRAKAPATVKDDTHGHYIRFYERSHTHARTHTHVAWDTHRHKQNPQTEKERQTKNGSQLPHCTATPHQHITAHTHLYIVREKEMGKKEDEAKGDEEDVPT